MFNKALMLGLMATAATADNWAVLIAGSNAYYNYRHQADVAHAYQVLTKGGVPKENIITMMFNDIANSSQNPFPGKVFNHPSTGAGWDVYEGVKIDYEGNDVSAKNFLAVLTGDSATTGGKKVLKSTANDNVFLNFVDHGGPGILGMPTGQPYLYAKDLQGALKTMHARKMYKELVFYVEACESGSIFEDFPTNLNQYVVTAADATESSWGTYCPPNDKVNGKELNSCLGDLFSVNWMQNADKTDLATETLEAQYTDVRKLTTKSHVMQFGDLTLTKEKAAQFEGKGNVHPSVAATAASGADAVDSRDNALVSLYHRYMRATGAKRSAAARELIQEIQDRETADAAFAAIVRSVAVETEVTTTKQVHPECYRAVFETARVSCAVSDYSMKYLKSLKMLCDSTNGDATRIVKQVLAHCQ